MNAARYFGGLYGGHSSGLSRSWQYVGELIASTLQLTKDTV